MAYYPALKAMLRYVPPIPPNPISSSTSDGHTSTHSDLLCQRPYSGVYPQLHQCLPLPPPPMDIPRFSVLFCAQWPPSAWIVLLHQMPILGVYHWFYQFFPLPPPTMAIQTPTVSSCTKYHTWVHTPTLPMPPSSSTSDDHILLRYLHSMVFVDAHYYPCLCVIVVVTLIHCLHPGAVNLSCTCSFFSCPKMVIWTPLFDMSRTCPGRVPNIGVLDCFQERAYDSPSQRQDTSYDTSSTNTSKPSLGINMQFFYKMTWRRWTWTWHMPNILWA